MLSVSLRALFGVTCVSRESVLIGTPTLEEFYGITSRRSRDYIRALPIKKRKSFSTVFPKATPEALDFLSKTLVRTDHTSGAVHDC